MSGVFRRPHDFRVQPGDEAALFGGGSPPVVDDPPHARHAEQERFHAAFRPAWAYRDNGAGLSVALFPAAPSADDPPLTRSLAQELAHAGLRPAFYPSRGFFLDPAIFPPAAAPDAPPLQGLDAQRAFWAAYRPSRLEPGRRWEYPPITEYDAVFGTGVEQVLFHLAYRPAPQPGTPFQFSPALFPAAQPDSPPIPALDAQEAFYAALRSPWVPSPAGLLNPALFPPPAADAPPLARSPAVEAFWAAYRPPTFQSRGYFLSGPLFPVVAPDEPPLPRPTGQEAFWAGFRTPFARTAFHHLAPPLFPVVVPDDPPLGGQSALIQLRAGRRDAFLPNLHAWRQMHPALIEAALVTVPTTEDEILDRLSELEAGCASLSALVTGTVIPDLELIKKYLRTILTDMKQNHDKTQRDLRKKGT